MVALVVLTVVNLTLLACVLVLTTVLARERETATAERTQLLDRIQAPEVVAASAPVRFAPPATPAVPRRFIRGRAGVGSVSVPIKDDEGMDEMGG